MGYYIDYIVMDERAISPTLIEAGLKQINPAYSIADNEGLMYGTARYGQLQMYYLGENSFEVKIGELLEEVKDYPVAGQNRVLLTLREARAIVTLQVLWGGREPEETFDRIEPLWQWLFAHREGVLKVEGEGYYDQSRLICAVG